MNIKDQVRPGDSFPGPLGELRAASTAGGGTALTTAAVLVALPKGVTTLIIIPRNYTGANVVKIATNPYLLVLRTQDTLATVTDYSENAQDANASTSVVMNSQGTAAQGYYLYVGSHVPFRGTKATIGNTNSNNSVLTVKYWNGSAWTDIVVTDGTASGGKTLAQNGDVTWTLPTDWVAAALSAIASPNPGAGVSYRDEPVYWTRWEVSLALDASVTLTSLLAYNRNTAAYSEWPLGIPFEERIIKGFGGVGCVEALTDAGTANLIVNVANRLGGAGIGL